MHKEIPPAFADAPVDNINSSRQAQVIERQSILIWQRSAMQN
jgi:hypothetical protein